MAPFLETCVVLELLENENGQYKNSQQSANLLILDHPDYMGDLALHITNHWNTWGNLDQLVLWQPLLRQVQDLSLARN